MEIPQIIVGHLAPDLDCLTAMWMLVRFGMAKQARLLFVPAGTTLNNQPPDADPQVLHVDTGGGRFDHHNEQGYDTCAAELVRLEVAPNDPVLERIAAQVTRIDQADVPRNKRAVFFNVTDLINGYNSLFPNRPHHVAEAMMPNFDAWYEYEARQLRLERSFSRRMEFSTPWGKGIAMQSEEGASSRLAFQQGAVLYAYRDGRGYMGIAAQSRSHVDLEPVYRVLKRVDSEADWYLHPNHRLLLCGTPKAPPRHYSHLSLEELVDVITSQNQRRH